QHAELLGHLERAVVTEHDATRSDPDMACLARDPRDHDLGSAAGKPGRAVMLGEPIAAVAEGIDVLRQFYTLQERIARRHSLADRRLVENAELQHGPEITQAGGDWHMPARPNLPGLTIRQGAAAMVMPRSRNGIEACLYTHRRLAGPTAGSREKSAS